MHTNVLHLKKLQKIEPYSKKRFFLQNLLRVKQFLMQAGNGQLEHFRTANQNQVIRKYQKGPIRTCKSRNGQKRGKSVRPSWHSPITGRSETNSIQSPFTSISRWTLLDYAFIYWPWQPHGTCLRPSFQLLSFPVLYFHRRQTTSPRHSKKHARRPTHMYLFVEINKSCVEILKDFNKATYERFNTTYIYNTYHCYLFSLRAGSPVWVSTCSAFSGTAAYYIIGSRLTKL